MVRKLQEIVATARSPVDPDTTPNQSARSSEDFDWWLPQSHARTTDMLSLLNTDPREPRVKLSHKLGLFIKIAVA
jgi:hypothetical protein